MADFKTTISLDDRKFAEGARRVNSHSRQMGKDVQRSFAAPTADELVRKFATVDVAFQTVRRGLTMAANAADNYASNNAELVAALGQTETAAERLSESLGQDLFFGMRAVQQGASGVVDRLLEARTAVVNFAADLIDGKGAAQEFDDTLRLLNRQMAETNQRRVMDAQGSTLAIEELKIEEGMARARNQNDASLLKMRRELLEVEARRQKRLEDINKLELSANRGDALRARANALSDREAALVRTEHRQAIADEQKASKAEEKRNELARTRLDLDERALAIRVRRLEGDRQGAEIEQTRLDFARKRLDLEERGLSVAEKRRRLSVLDGLERRTVAALGQGGGTDGERRTAAIGVLGGRQVVAQQLGVNAQRTTASNTQRIAMLVDGLPPILRGILQAVQSGQAATYGP